MKIPKFFQTITNFTGKKVNTMSTSTNQPETVESLSIYEKKSGQAQNFLAHMGQNFTWPTSMPDHFRKLVFWAFTDDVNSFNDDKENARNYLYFYVNLDKGTFGSHTNDWVLIYHQKVKKYRSSEYTNKQLILLDDKMPGALYLPVDQSYLVDTKPAKTVRALCDSNAAEYLIRIRIKRVGAADSNSICLGYQFRDTLNNNKQYKTILATGSSETILPYYVASQLGKRGWSRHSRNVIGYGAPARVFYAVTPFLVSIGDNVNWSKWVQTDTLKLWEQIPGDQVDCSIVGNDVLGQFTMVHHPAQGLNFLSDANEAHLLAFLNELSRKNGTADRTERQSIQEVYEIDG